MHLCVAQPFYPRCSPLGPSLPYPHLGSSWLPTLQISDMGIARALKQNETQITRHVKGAHNSPPLFHPPLPSTPLHWHPTAGMLAPRLRSAATTQLIRPSAGTDGYLDPEYAQNGELSFATDAYSFGVILMEMLSSTSARGHLVRYRAFGDRARGNAESIWWQHLPAQNIHGLAASGRTAPSQVPDDYSCLL